MDEKTKTIIDRARAMLAAATPGPWEVCPDTRPDVRTTCNTGGFLGCGHIATVSRYDANEADAALIAAAPGLLATLCDAMETAERRAEEAEAQANECRSVVQMVGDCIEEWAANEFIVVDYDDEPMPSIRRVVTGTTAGRALLDRLHAAEARVAEVEAAQKMRAESADPDDETWHTREEYLRRVKAEARVADLESVRVEQAEKLRRHLDEIAELRDRAGIAEGREAAAKANAEQMAGWLNARNAGLVQMARERDALRTEVEALRIERDVADRECDRLRAQVDADRQELTRLAEKVARMEARTAWLCDCMAMPFAENKGASDCPDCHGSGAVIVEGGE